ncbi:uncharacterized protein LOC117652757 [Thrips palmi]|uniref:Uncharacterized protein LOC117652757 n=1 Tax=Thrips palmi TaxID=161013 RepID=A0A6P9AD17_THRPL|nr:uncharacterized protein LOC117652757 [Thrips palmi]
MQPQEVPLASLLSSRHLERLRADGGSGSATVDNLWAATLAGDLAEVSAYQGPSARGALALGPGGTWNDTLIPRVRYLSRERPGSPELAPVQHWDMTDAEIRGGFDGLALGYRIARWTARTGRLRLSQLLDMYYSPRGVALDAEVKACQRGSSAAAAFAEDTLFAQTSRFARTLTDTSPDAPYMTEAALRNFTAASVRAFLRYAGDLLQGDACDSPPLMSVRVNAIVVLDTTWARAAAYRFITLLAGAEGIDVGLFGSRLAIMNGGLGGPVGGHWIVNFTDSPVQIATDWVAVDAADDIWPTYLDLPWTLMAVIEHLQSKAEAESVQGSVGSAHGDVVVILATASTVSDADMRHAKELVPRVKEINPDVRLLYVVTELGEARFQELATMSAEWDDVVVVVDDTEADTVAHAVASYLRHTPGRLMPAECVLTQGGSPSSTPSPSRSTSRPYAAAARGNHARAKGWPVQPGLHVWAAPGVRGRGGWSRAGGGGARMGSRAEFEDYVAPGQLRLYRIHTEYTRPGMPVSVEMVGEDYGELRLCMWRGAAPGGAMAAMRAALRAEDAGGVDPGRGDRDDTPQAECANLSGFGETNVTIADPCQDRCAPLYVSVSASKSTFKCTEEDCRYPDEVRYLLRPRGVSCAGSLPVQSGSTTCTTSPASLSLWVAALAAQLVLLLAAH